MGLHSPTKHQSLGLRKGAWTPEEDALLRNCVEKYGVVRWRLMPQRAEKLTMDYISVLNGEGLNRCPKSCRLRWLNYLCPSIKRGKFEDDEVDLIIRLHKLLGNRWSLIAGRLPGRTANGVKNYWNSHLSKKLDAKDGEGESTTHVKVFKPQPRTIPVNWIWLKDVHKSGGKHHQEEPHISKQPSSSENHAPCLEKIIISDGLNRPIVSHIDNEMTEELQTKFGTENGEIFRDEELFMEGFRGWEDLDLDINLWGDLGWSI